MPKSPTRRRRPPHRSGSFPNLRWGLALCALAGIVTAGAARADDQPVDLELVLAVDVSQSVDAYEGRLQRLGYVRAFADPAIAEAIAGGIHGRIAVTYVEWAGPGLWRVTADWRLIASAEDARALADTLGSVPVARGVGTSITSLIFQASRMFEGNGFAGERQVIDISGDGPNSSGGPVTVVRDAAVAAGIIINGVAINNFDGSMFSLPDLDVYYRECVIGGPGSFVLAADGFEAFAEAIRRKLILEIADAAPPAGGVPAELPPGGVRAQALAAPIAPAASEAGILPFVLAQAGGLNDPAPGKYAPACDIGERMRMRDNPGLRPPR